MRRCRDWFLAVGTEDEWLPNLDRPVNFLGHIICFCLEVLCLLINYVLPIALIVVVLMTIFIGR